MGGVRLSGHKLRLIMKSRQKEVVSSRIAQGRWSTDSPQHQPSQPATRPEPVAKQEEISEMMAQLEGRPSL